MKRRQILPLPRLALSIAEREKLIVSREKASKDLRLSKEQRATARKRAEQLKKIQAKRIQQQSAAPKD